MGGLSSAMEIPEEQGRRPGENDRYSPESDTPGGRYQQRPTSSRDRSRSPLDVQPPSPPPNHRSMRYPSPNLRRV
ncbi:hypothetical protein U1Q18_019426 [Sarracenia purpurea var. burkii]